VDRPPVLPPRGFSPKGAVPLQKGPSGEELPNISPERTTKRRAKPPGGGTPTNKPGPKGTTTGAPPQLEKPPWGKKKPGEEEYPQTRITPMEGGVPL